MHRVMFEAKVDATFFNYSHHDLIHLDENNHQTWRHMSSEILRRTKNTIEVSLKLLEKEPTFKAAFFCKVGKIECPVLLVNGCDDQNWATEEYAEDVRRHTHSLHNGHAYHMLMFPVCLDL